MHWVKAHSVIDTRMVNQQKKGICGVVKGEFCNVHNPVRPVVTMIELSLLVSSYLVGIH